MRHTRTRTWAPALALAALVSLHCGDGSRPEPVAPQPLAATTAGAGIQLDQWNATMGNETNPQMIIKGFNPTNPHNGDAIVATFFWFGAPGGVTGNVIDSVTDVLTTSPYTPVGNTYRLVQFTTNGHVSMATYVATNVQNFPDAGTDVSRILAIKASLKVPFVDAGILLSAWTGVAGVTTNALGAFASSSGTGLSTTVSGPTSGGPGAITVNPGALAYGVAMASPPAGTDGPSGWSAFGTPSDLLMSSNGSFDASFTTSTSGGTVDPRWSFFFTTPGSWLATVLALNPAP